MTSITVMYLIPLESKVSPSESVANCCRSKRHVNIGGWDRTCMEMIWDDFRSGILLGNFKTWHQKKLGGLPVSEHNKIKFISETEKDLFTDWSKNILKMGFLCGVLSLLQSFYCMLRLFCLLPWRWTEHVVYHVGKLTLWSTFFCWLFVAPPRRLSITRATTPRQRAPPRWRPLTSWSPAPPPSGWNLLQACRRGDNLIWDYILP